MIEFERFKKVQLVLYVGDKNGNLNTLVLATEEDLRAAGYVRASEVARQDVAEPAPKGMKTSSTTCESCIYLDDSAFESSKASSDDIHVLPICNHFGRRKLIKSDGRPQRCEECLRKQWKEKVQADVDPFCGNCERLADAGPFGGPTKPYCENLGHRHRLGEVWWRPVRCEECIAKQCKAELVKP